MGSQISDVKKRLKSEHFSSDFRQRSKTELSGTGPKVKRPRTKLVRISAFHCKIFPYWTKPCFVLQCRMRKGVKPPRDFFDSFHVCTTYVLGMEIKWLYSECPKSEQV